MKQKGNSKAGGVFAIILLGGLIVFYIVTAILSLVGLGGAKSLSSNFTDNPKEGEYIEGYFHIGTDILLTMKHTINLIPTGNEYYFAVFNDEFNKMLIVRADKKFSENFPVADTEGGSFIRLNESGYSFKGKMRKMDYKEKKEFSEFISDARADGVETVASGDDILFLDATTGHIAVLKLIFGGCLIGAILLFAYVSSTSKKEKMAASGVSPDMMPKQSTLDLQLTDVFGQPAQPAADQNAFQDPNLERFGITEPQQTATINNAPQKKGIKGPKDIAAIVSIVLFFGGLIGILYTMTFM